MVMLCLAAHFPASTTAPQRLCSRRAPTPSRATTLASRITSALDAHPSRRDDDEGAALAAAVVFPSGRRRAIAGFGATTLAAALSRQVEP
jgi:hypothetical protein